MNAARVSLGWIAAICALIRPALGQVPAPASSPPLALWTFTPPAHDHGRDARDAASLVRNLASSFVTESDAPEDSGLAIASRTLAWSLCSPAPIRVEIRRWPSAAATAQIVVRLDIPAANGTHDPLLAAFAAGLNTTSFSSPGEPARLYHVSTRAGARVAAALSTPEALWLAVGVADDSSLTPQLGTTPPEMPAFDKALDALAAPALSRVLEGFIDVNALRSDAPEPWSFGPEARSLDALGIPNVRALGFRARLAPPAGSATPSAPPASSPPLLLIDLAWSARSEPPGTAHAATIGEPQWPAGAGVSAPSNAGFVFVLRADGGLPGPPSIGWSMGWGALFRSSLALAQATEPTASGRAIIAGRSAWLNFHTDALRRVSSSLDRWLIIAPASSAEAPPSPALLAFAPFSPPDRAARIKLGMNMLLGDTKPAVTFAEVTDTWTLPRRTGQVISEIGWSLLPAGGTPRALVAGLSLADAPPTSAQLLGQASAWLAPASPR